MGVGELPGRVSDEGRVFAIHGGFMHVLSGEVIVLADADERADEIDIERAEAARQRALETLKMRRPKSNG